MFELARTDVDPAMARVFLNVSAEYYPERLGHFVVLDAPSVFNMLFKVPIPLPSAAVAHRFVPLASMRLITTYVTCRLVPCTSGCICDRAEAPHA